MSEHVGHGPYEPAVESIPKKGTDIKDKPKRGTATVPGLDAKGEPVKAEAPAPKKKAAKKKSK
jgi:hypothetical protein